MDLVAVTAFGILYTIATLILLALGLAVIFGMMGVINLAQAEFLMVGAYTVLIVTAHGASVWIGIAVAPVVVGLLGLVIERRSEEHTSELQSQSNLVCRLLLEKKKNT